jgi:hypothetical protein
MWARSMLAVEGLAEGEPRGAPFSAADEMIE